MSQFHYSQSPELLNNSCPNGVPIFLNVLDLCVNDTKTWFAVICGILSILAWVVYGLPQMIINCRKGIPDEAISPWLLIFWTIGDTSNMVGAILTKQLTLQIAMAAYAIFCDIILVAQFTYAILKNRWKKKQLVGPQNAIYDETGNYIDSVSVNTPGNSNMNKSKVTGAALFCISIFCINFISFHNYPETKYVGRTLLSQGQPDKFFTGIVEIFGYVLGCLSSLFYSSGRIPQICMNFRRKCTDGLSAGLFIFAILGNATYGAQILLISVEYMYILKHLPWILGSWGVMILDCIILLQFYAYRKNKLPAYAVLSDLEDDDSESDSGLLS